MSARSVIILVVCTSLLGCTEREEVPDSNDAAHAREVSRGVEIAPVQQVEPEHNDTIAENTEPPPLSDVAVEEPPSEQLPAYTLIGHPKPYHFANVRRFVVNIRVERGLTRSEVEEVLERAAREFHASRGGEAIDVLAFAPGDEVGGIGTVGSGIFAPNGNWGDTMTGDPMEFRVYDLRESYFRPIEEIEQWLPGSTVTLHSHDGEAIQVDPEHDRWYRSEAIAHIPGGTEAKILRRFTQPRSGSSDFVRYWIRFEFDGKLIQGWVHRSAVEGPDSP